MDGKEFEIGRLLRAGIAGFFVGCRVSEVEAPRFGALVKAPLDAEGRMQTYGLIYDIHIDDFDALVSKSGFEQLAHPTVVLEEEYPQHSS